MGKFEFENQGTNTYLVYTLDEEEEIDTMSLGMITNNHIKGIADTVYYQLDDTRQIKYNVTAKVSLKQFFAGAVNKKRLLSVFSAILDAMSEIEDYMLDAQSILLDKEYIFVNVATYEIGLICIPTKREGVENSDLGRFFKEMVFTTQFDQTENTNYVAQLLSFFNRNPVFSMDEFKKELEQLDNFVGVNTTQVQQPVPPVSIPSVSPVASSSVVPPTTPTPSPNVVPSGGMNLSGNVVKPVNPIISEKPPVHVIIQEKVQPPKNMPDFSNGTVSSGINIPGKENVAILGNGSVNIPGKPPVSDDKEKSSEHKTEEKPMSTWYLLQHYSKKNAAIYKEQKAAKKAEKQASKKKGRDEKEEESFVVPGAPVNQGNSQQIQNNNQQQVQQAQAMQQVQEEQIRQQQMQQMQEAQRRQQQAQEAQRLQQLQMQQAQEIQRRQQLEAQRLQQMQQMQQMQMQQVQQTEEAQLLPPQVGKYGDTTVLNQNGAGETTVLNQNEVQQTQQPYLIRRKNSERIPINKPAFRIGKERSYVDYFIADNSAISRSHANIINKNGKYFIVDTNSTNHTYINGVMIQSNVEVELAHGMNVRLANEEFEFRML